MTEPINILWAPTTLRASVNGAIDNKDESEVFYFGIQLDIRDSRSAFLNLMCNGVHAISLVLDLMATVTNIGERQEKEMPSVHYIYSRLGVELTVGVTCDKADSNDVVAFEYVLSQYSMYFVRGAEMSVEELDNYGHKPNLLAQGFEGTGVVIRHALKSGGKAVGSAVRYLGKSYTDTAVRSNDYWQKPMGNREVTQAEADSALRRKAQAEDIHMGARTLTGAALYPVRWTGRKAAQLASFNSEETTATTSSSAKRAVMDTIGGIGNAVSSICKGFTEAMGEVGSAVGETALTHSKTVYGDEYADAVTKHYVDACTEIGLAGYKVLNVASFGAYGVMLDAVVEGATLLISLYDYLVGPVLMQGYVDLLQPPLTSPSRYFAVLRPWSLSFYRCAADFTGKPFKIIATAMMDTLPKYRKRNSPSDQNHFEDSNEESVVNEGSLSFADDRLDLNKQGNNSGIVDIIQIEGDEEDTVMVEKLPETDCLTSYAEKLDTTLQSWRGGDRDHIEICTVDCSTFLLYVAVDGETQDAESRRPKELLENWLKELSEACTRVETIKKRRSGAEEIAVRRRLAMLPKEKRVAVTFRSLIMASEQSILNQLCVDESSAVDVDASINIVSEIVDSEVELTSIDINLLQQIDSLQSGELADHGTSGNGGVDAIDEQQEVHQHDQFWLNRAPQSKNHDGLLESQTSSGSVATAMASIRQELGRMTDPVRDALLREVRVTVLPISMNGVKIRSEEKVTNSTAVGVPMSKRSDGHSFLEARWSSANSQPSRDESGWSEVQDSSETLEFGDQACLDERECRSLDLTIEATTIYGTKLELGVASIEFSNIPELDESCFPCVAAENTEVDLDGISLASIAEPTRRCQKPQYESPSLNPEQQNRGERQPVAAKTSMNVSRWVDVVHRQSGRVVGKLFIDICSHKPL